VSEDAERQCRNEQRSAYADDDSDGEGNELANELTPADDRTRACATGCPPSDTEPQCGATDDANGYRRYRRIERCARHAEQGCGDDDEYEAQCTEQCSGCEQQQRAEYADHTGAGNRVDGSATTHGLATFAEAGDRDGLGGRGRSAGGGGAILRGGTGGVHRGHRRHRAWLRSVLVVAGLAAVVGERRALATLRGRDIADHVAGEIVGREVTPLELTSAPVYRMVSRIHTVISGVTSRLPDTDAALLRGLLIGDDRDHPEELVRAFRAAGMGHLVAVSGQNVALVLAWVAPLIAGRRRSVRVAVIVLVVALFAFVTRLEPSVVRAAVMVIIVRGAAAYGREIGAARALLVTVAVLLVVDPFLVRSVGFVLSVAATAGLVFLTPGLASVLGTGAVARIAAATIAAQLAVAPFALWWFGSLPIVAVPANVVAVPIASGVMVVGLPLVLACGALEGLASLIAGVLAPGAAHVVSVIVDGAVDAALVPLRIGVRAIWWVAVVAERASPSPGVNLLAWVVAYCACVLSIVRRRARGGGDSAVPAAGSVM